MEFKCGKVPIKSLLIQSPARSLEKRGTAASHETGTLIQTWGIPYYVISHLIVHRRRGAWDQKIPDF